LIAVLAVLTVLAVLAASFAVLIQLDVANANAQLELQRLNLLLESGVSHAVAVLQQAQAQGETISMPPRGMLRQAFGAATAGAGDGGAHAAAAGRWIDVVNNRGVIEGRYCVAVEDEAAKINLNTAFLLQRSRGAGWLPGESALTHALGLPTQVVERVLHFRYGPNRVPGARGDDDRNNVLLMADGIDNNANGSIDEDDEGVEDPGEYSPHYPMGDDRRITSISEALNILLGGPINLTLESRHLIQREVPQRATLYSLDLPGSASLPDGDPADVNAFSARQARKLIGRANMLKPFGGTQRDLDQLAVNIVDYRDQNHVLSTHASLYGVEAINFNEVLANDGTTGRNMRDSLNTGNVGVNDERFIVSSGSVINNGASWVAYGGGNNLLYNSGNAGAWDCEVDGARLRLLGPAKNHASGAELWSGERLQRYQRYRDICGNIGAHRGVALSGTPGRGIDSSVYDSMTWPVNLFQHGFACVGFTRRESLANDNNLAAQANGIRIVSSTADGRLSLAQPVSLPNTNFVTRCVVYTWDSRDYIRSHAPRTTAAIVFQKLQPNRYYLPVLSGWPSADYPDVMNKLAFGPYNELDDERDPVNNKWEYGGAEHDAIPVRTTGRGNLAVYVRAGRDTKYRPQPGEWSYSANCWNMTFARPEVIELMNVSGRTISLRNWTLTFNTGSIANDIGMIDYGQGFSLNTAGARDPNPTIEPQGYFYLVNNVRLFNADFGGGSPSPNWGDSASQYVPVWKIPSDAWGVQYRIQQGGQDGQLCRVTFESATFKPGQFKGEVCEGMRLAQGGGLEVSHVNGSRYEILDNGRNYITFALPNPGWDWRHYAPNNSTYARAANTIMLLGMPAKGGIVSMTLKNEYKQVVARTVEYAYLDTEPVTWFGSSAEKTDATHYNWIVRRTPSISGRPERAINSAVRGKSRAPTHIKDGNYVSVGELQRVRVGSDFENIGAGRSAVRQRETLAGLASVFGSSAVRLEACDERAERAGWQAALQAVTTYQPGSISADDAAWENDQWRFQTVRFMTGKLRGESFPIAGNTRTTLQLAAPRDSAAVRSSPGRKSLQPSRGDLFAVGPGYASALCYARRPEQKGEWTWRQRIAMPGRYHLYIFGLNDSISTTEFLEENDNAGLDIEVWNFSGQHYDLLARNQRYGKDDAVYAGRIAPEHVSDNGDFKLRLTAHGVGERGVGRAVEQGVQAQRRRQSGFAWFNYAVLTPVPVPGRVNANTAGPRLLASLPGITPNLAQDIFDGVDAGGRAVLKPYTHAGELVNVRGMTPEIFERCANLFCLDSSAYTVDIQVQTVKDVNGDGIFDPRNEPVQSTRRKRLVVRAATPAGGSHGVDILERYSP